MVLADFKGSPLIITFFLARCPDCNEEALLLNEVLGIGAGLEIAALAERNGIRYPVLLDLNQAVANLFGVSQVPHTVFIDRKGHMLAQYDELIEGENLREKLEKILAE